MFNVIFANDYLNRGPLVSEATTLPTEPQPLSINSSILVWSTGKEEAISSKEKIIEWNENR